MAEPGQTSKPTPDETSKPTLEPSKPTPDETSKPRQPDSPPKLTLGDMIAWGRHYETLLKGPPGYLVPRPMLDHYIAAANEALERQQREQERKKPPSRAGRPYGGMGEQRARLVAAGVRGDAADLIVAKTHRRPVKSVKRAVKRTSKKPRR